MLRALLPAIATLGVAAPLWAQCPDGSPPPCGRPAARAPAPNSVAVLYFDNLSRDTADAYLADGLTEEIIIRLAQVRRLEVKSRFETQRFRGRPALDPASLGRSLNAAYLVTGSVQRGGDRVRLRVALVRAATRDQAWADVIDRASGDLLAVESDIAREVATAITGQLLPEERSRLARRVTDDPLAYEEYLRGLKDLHSSFDEAAARGALAHFDRAIARDSGFAAAFSEQAVAWASLSDGHVPGREGYARARRAAEQALLRDSSQALSYALLSAAALAIDLDAHKAEQLARQGVQFDPQERESHVNLSRALFAQGRLDESILEAQRAWQLDSLGSFYGFWNFLVLIYGHRLDDAAALLTRLRRILSPVDMDPMEGMLRAARGDLRGAEPLLDWRYYGGRVAGIYARALLARGDSAAARATIDSMVAVRAAGYYNPVALARAYAALGDRDRGLQWLQQAFEERTAWLIYVPVDDELAPLRSDPRYTALAQLLHYR